MTERKVTLTESELEELMARAVSRGLRDVGIIADDTDSVEKHRRDFMFLRDLRLAKESVIGKTIAATITLIVGGFCVLLVIGFRGWTRLS
jgi:hypothetical protein